MKKQALLFYVFFISLLFCFNLFSQDVTVQIQVGESKNLSDRLGNCIVANSYQVTPIFPGTIDFMDREVTVSNFGAVFANFTISALLTTSPRNYDGKVIYEVFQINGSLCLVDTVEIAVEVIPALQPVPNFETFPRVVIEGSTVQFNNLTENPVTEWLWEFGDGNMSTEINPSNRYELPGKYAVSLTATGPGGIASITKEDYIEVVESGTPGQSIWTFETTGRAGTPGIGKDGTIYFSSSDGNTYAINPDGIKRWSIGLAINTPVIGNSNTVYGTNGGNLIAINSNGIEKWQFRLDENINGAIALSLDETIYLGTRMGRLYAVDSSGIEKWNIDLEARDGLFDPIIGTDGTIYVIAEFEGSERKILAINPSGNVKWEFDVGRNIFNLSGLSISRSGAIIVTGFPTFALDPSGHILWEQLRAGNPIIISQIVFDENGNMYGTSGSEKIYSMNSRTGEVNWSLDLSPYLTGFRKDISDPLIGSDGLIYCYSKAGVAFAINPAGELLWHTTFVPEGFSPNAFVFEDSPNMNSSGSLYIGYDDGKLHSFSTSSPGILENVWAKEGQNNQNTRSFLCPFPFLMTPVDSLVDQDISQLFEWTPVFQASEYEITLSTSENFTNVIQSQIVSDTSVQFLNLEQGNYYWRVRPILGDNVIGCWSETRFFKKEILTKIEFTKLNIALNIYPNPAKEKLFIEFTSSNKFNSNFLIYDALGKMIYSSNEEISLGENLIEIDLEALPSGNYFIQILGNEINAVNKFVIDQ